jgi:hypothetical protein
MVKQVAQEQRGKATMAVVVLLQPPCRVAAVVVKARVVKMVSAVLVAAMAVPEKPILLRALP